MIKILNNYNVDYCVKKKSKNKNDNRYDIL